MTCHPRAVLLPAGIPRNFCTLGLWGLVVARHSVVSVAGRGVGHVSSINTSPSRYSDIILISAFIAALSESKDEKKRFTAIGRQSLELHSKFHLLWQTRQCQCSASLFSLTSLYELKDEATINITVLLLGIPTPQALFLKSHGQHSTNIDTWADFLLNNPGNTRKIMHNKMARSDKDSK